VREPSVQRHQSAPAPQAGGRDHVGLDALIGGFVVLDEQGLVEQEAPGGGPPLAKPAGGRLSVAPPSW
jgi:hypothetical protein